MQTTETGSSVASTVQPSNKPLEQDGSPISATAPGSVRVIKRNGKVVPYTSDKIAVAMTKAFLAVEGGTAAASSRIHETVANLTSQIEATFLRRMPSGGTIHIEEIQDQVELVLMRSGEQKIARSYVLYREGRAQARDTSTEGNPQVSIEFPDISITMRDGSTQKIDAERIQTVVQEACTDLKDVEAELILKESMRNLYDGVSWDDVNTSLVISARTLVEKEPNYSFATARLLLDKIRAEALGYLDVAEQATQAEMSTHYPKALSNYIKRGVELELLSPELLSFDLAKLGEAILPERDLQFSYLGLQTLYDRYFIHDNDTRIELPQIFFMRVAMGLAMREQNKNARAIEFYQLLSSFDYMSSTPTLFNSGTLRPQLSSCYLTSVPDDLHGIYGAMQDNAMLRYVRLAHESKVPTVNLKGLCPF